MTTGDGMGDAKERAEAEYERALEDPSAWEDDPPPDSRPKHKLATQVTVRLTPHLAEQIREIASSAGIGYTSLVRQWIEERASEESTRSVARNRVQYTVVSTVLSPPAEFRWTQRSALLERV